MPIDTPVKRASVLALCLPAGHGEQIPTGTIGTVGRQFAALCYVGILAGSPPVFRPAWARNANAIFGPTTPVTPVNE